MSTNEMESAFLRSLSETLNEALEAEGTNIRFVEKIGNILYFAKNEKEFGITEQELLVADESVLDLLKKRAVL